MSNMSLQIPEINHKKTQKTAYTTCALLAELTVRRRVVRRIHLLQRSVFLQSKNSISHLEPDNNRPICEKIDGSGGRTLQKQLQAFMNQGLLDKAQVSLFF